MPEERKIFWTTAFLVPICFAIFVDLLFGYFFAIRQVIVVLIPLCYLAGNGVAVLYGQMPRLAVIITVLTVSLFTVYSANWLTKVNEDWTAAAEMALAHAGPGGCILILPDSVAPLSRLIHPQLSAQACNMHSQIHTDDKIVLLDSGYEDSDPAIQAYVQSAKDKLKLHSEHRLGRMTITLLRAQ